MCKRLATPDGPTPGHATFWDLRPGGADLKPATLAFDEADRAILIRDLPMDQAISFWALPEI